MLRLEPLTLGQASRALYVRFVPANHPLRRLDEVLRDCEFVGLLVGK